MSTRPILLSRVTIVAVVALGVCLARVGIAPSLAAPPAESPRQIEQPIRLAQIDPDTVIDLPIRPDRLIESPVERTRNEIVRRPMSPPSIHGIAEIGGKKIPLRFRIMTTPQLKPGLDDGESGGFFEPLAAAARAGDDVAAHRLYEALRKCRYYPKTQAEFDARVAAGRKWWAQTGGFVAPGETLDLEESITNLERSFKRCEGVTPEMYATAIELLRASVEHGYDDNRLLYAIAIYPTDPKDAEAQVELAWREGYIEALRMLGDSSLAHRIAAIAADIADGSVNAKEQLAELEAKTSPSEFQEATKEAARILRNPSCCKY